MTRGRVHRCKGSPSRTTRWQWAQGPARFSLHGRTSASGGADGRVSVWDTTSNDPYGLRRHADDVEAPEDGVHGTQLATTGIDHVVRIFDTVTRRVVATFRRHTGTVSSMAFSPSDEWIASAGADRTARVWRPRPPNHFGVLTAHTDAVSSVALSLWSSDSGQLRSTHSGHPGGTRALALPRHESGLLGAGADGCVRL